MSSANDRWQTVCNAGALRNDGGTTEITMRSLRIPVAAGLLCMATMTNAHASIQGG